MVVNLQRTTFRTSRRLDFFSVKELVAQTGHSEVDWPLVVLKELLDNSLDACEEAGIAPDLSVRVDGEGITVADNGPGIPPERLEEIFGRTRARNGASGLGLLISRRLAELNGGRLWVESPPEGGIAFHVALPRRRRARGVERESVRA